jgi:hypothetical protein
MTDAPVCAKLREALSRLLDDAYEQDLRANLAERGQELWLLGIDSGSQRLTDICGTIGPELLAAVQPSRFIGTDAGCRADAQSVLPLKGRRAERPCRPRRHGPCGSRSR